jgi:ATP-binding cassette subfamily C (CFTR/MRP) protein 2
MQVKVGGSIAYVAQSAWIQNGTIRDNILFGKELDHVKYKNTLKVCALENDLCQMTYGDKTEIGERGINLSGGQKQRVQLARAYYQSADIYVLDDIFSALDAHTGSYLFKVSMF